MGIHENLRRLNLQLPKINPPLGSYVATVQSNDLIFTSGCLPFKADGSLITGRIGETLTLEQGHKAAQTAALYLLAVLAEHLRGGIESLEKIRQIVKVSGFMQTTSDFFDHPQVLNGASDLLVQLFGDCGKHTRAAMGVYTLPKNAAVEIEMLVRI